MYLPNRDLRGQVTSRCVVHRVTAGEYLGYVIIAEFGYLLGGRRMFV